MGSPTVRNRPVEVDVHGAGTGWLAARLSYAGVEFSQRGAAFIWVQAKFGSVGAEFSWVEAEFSQAGAKFSWVEANSGVDREKLA
jgi:hypothetical protein